MKDLKGKRFGRLEVIEPLNDRIDGRVVWRCKCDCGKFADIKSSNLLSGKTRSCGCYREESRKVARAQDLTGKRFGRLVAIRPTDERYRDTVIVWECKCDCGKTCKATSYALTHGKKRSCGCMVKENKISDEVREKSNKYAKLDTVDGTRISSIKDPQKLRRNNTSGVTGVYEKNGKWVSRIRFKRKYYHLGTYQDKDDAIRARRLAEDMIYGEFLEWYAENYPERWEKMKMKEDKNE